MIYDKSKVDLTSLAKDQRLIDSCISAKSTLTPADIRRNLDIAWTITTSHEEKSETQNKAEEVEPKPEIDYGNVCPDCGGPLKRAGICYVCYAGCGASTGGCS